MFNESFIFGHGVDPSHRDEIKFNNGSFLYNRAHRNTTQVSSLIFEVFIHFQDCSFQVVAVNERPCKSLPEFVPPYCELVRRPDQSPFIVVTLRDEEDDTKGCTAILDMQTLEWTRTKQDQRMSPMQGPLFSFANQTRLIYVDKIDGQIFEYINVNKGWRKWESKMPIPPNIKILMLQLFPMGEPRGEFCPKDQPDQTKSLSLDLDQWKVKKFCWDDDNKKPISPRKYC